MYISMLSFGVPPNTNSEGSIEPVEFFMKQLCENINFLKRPHTDLR